MFIKKHTSIIFLLQFGPLEGAIFADYGTDLGSGQTVPGIRNLSRTKEFVGIDHEYIWTK